MRKFYFHTRQSPWTMDRESCSHSWSQSTFPFASLRTRNQNIQWLKFLESNWSLKQKPLFNHWCNKKLGRYEYIFRLLTNVLFMTPTLFLYFYLPLVGISHDDASALLVVLSNAHLCHIFGPFDPQRLIDLILLRIIQNNMTN